MSDLDAHDPNEGIAIVGMSGRFPGARNIAEFWQNLRDGVESIATFSADDVASSGIDPTMLRHPGYVNAGGILDDIELFDAAFFGFNPREAEITDPQQRLFIESAWETLENAGYDPARYEGVIGVFGGTGMSKYVFNLYTNPEFMALVGGLQVLLGNDKDHLTTRVAYKLNLKGPAITVQTACSTSLVAVCLACQSLLNYQCDMALAGGASIAVPQKTGYLYQLGGINSPDGHCRAFDAAAQGTVGGNGVATVLLKRLADALADGDTIRAVIKGCAINNDGSGKVGYTAPSMDGQAEVIAMAQAMAGIDPDTITYIEAHGTATPLGDPIEIAALTRAFRAQTPKQNFCAIGSVKTNIGHLDPAAGIAGLIKTVLAMEHGIIPPSLHFKQPNPKIDFANSPFYVNATQSPWRSPQGPRRAGVSSFGIGGTNAHIVLEEAPTVEPSAPGRPWELMVLSARTATALDTATAQMVSYLRQHPDLDVGDVAYTYAVGRQAFSHRRMVVCQTLEDAADVLGTLDPRRVASSAEEPAERPCVFMFSGQGAQYVNMGWELYVVEPVFREQVDHCCDLLRPHLGFDLRCVLFPDAEHAEAIPRPAEVFHPTDLQQTALAQPALFVVEYALARLWMAWGVHPRAMLGHSIGEYVAACLSGVFSLEDALEMVALRGQMMQQMRGGAMLTVTLSESEVQALLGGDLSVAAINAPGHCVVSGPMEAIAALELRLAEQGVASGRLHTSHAFHSAMMEPVVAPFVERLREIRLRSPQIPFLSNVTGTWITAEEATDPCYWGRHLRQTVRFADGLRQLSQAGEWIMLEVGPGRTLSTLVRQQPVVAVGRSVFESLHHPQDRQPDLAFLLNTLGRLWLSGVAVDWASFYAYQSRRRIPLPTYPFERKRFWVEAQRQAQPTAPRQATSQKKANIAEWLYIPSWQRARQPEFSLHSRQARPTNGATADQASGWLVFGDMYGLSDQIVKRLKQADREVTTVVAGARFTRLGDHAYVIDPRSREDYDTLLRDLHANGSSPQTIAHLWSLTPDDRVPATVESFEAYQASGFYSLLFLAQALGKQLITHPLQIGVVSNQMQAVTGEEMLCPAKATVLGPCKVIPQEYPHITCRSIDVIMPVMGVKPEESLADRLIAELDAQPPERVVAFRDGRWVQTFESMRPKQAAVEETAHGASRPPRLREGGVYLITGGLGRIGLTLARHLAETVRARLILVGRSALPPRERWEERLSTNADQDGSSYKIQQLQAMERLGAQVMVLEADVADLQAMRRVVERATERFGAIHGLFHAAGVVTPTTSRAIPEMDMASCARHFQPKAYGLYVLDEVLRGVPLDFCLLFSSLSSVLGGLGFVAYAAANSFMDAFAHRQARTSTVPWISVNWDGWQFGPTGKQPAGAGAALADLAIMPEEGMQIIPHALAATPQIVISTSDLQARIDQWIKLESLHAADQAGPGQAGELHARPALHTTYVAPRSAVEQTIAELWTLLLGVKQVGVVDNFFELGGHSLLAIQLISRLRDAFQIELPVQTLFDAPTVADLAQAIEHRRQAVQDDADKLAEMLEYIEQLSEEEVRALLAEAQAQEHSQ